MCETCEEYERAIKIAKDVRDGFFIKLSDRHWLVGFLNRELDQHVDVAGEASFQ